MRLGLEIEAERFGDPNPWIVRNVLLDLDEAGHNVFPAEDASLQSGIEVKPTWPLAARKADAWSQRICHVLTAQSYDVVSGRPGLHIHLDRASMPRKVAADWLAALHAMVIVAGISAVAPEALRAADWLCSSWLRVRPRADGGGYARGLSQANLVSFVQQLRLGHWDDAMTYISGHNCAISYSGRWPTFEVRAGCATLDAGRIALLIERLRLLTVASRQGMFRAEVDEIAACSTTGHSAQDERRRQEAVYGAAQAAINAADILAMHRAAKVEVHRDEIVREVDGLIASWRNKRPTARGAQDYRSRRTARLCSTCSQDRRYCRPSCTCTGCVGCRVCGAGAGQPCRERCACSECYEALYVAWRREHTCCSGRSAVSGVSIECSPDRCGCRSCHSYRWSHYGYDYLPRCRCARCLEYRRENNLTTPR